MKVRTPFIIISRIIIIIIIMFFVFPIGWLGFIATGVMDGHGKWWKATKEISSTFFLKDWWVDW